MRKLVCASAVRPRNRAMLFAASLAGLLAMVTGHLWIGIAVATCGVFTYGALVFHDVFDPQLIRQVHDLGDAADMSRRLSLPPIKGTVAGEFVVDAIANDELRKLYTQILQAHEAVRLGIAEIDEQTRPSLRDAYRCCTEMRELAGPLVARGIELSTYLAKTTQDRIESEIHGLECEAQHARDSAAKLMLESAAKSKLELLETYMEVEDVYERIKAELLVIKVSLEAIYGRLVKLNSSEYQGAEDPATVLADLRMSLCSDFDDLELGVGELSDS